MYICDICNIPISKPSHLSIILPSRDLHLQRLPTISQILRHKHRGLLSDQQRRTISVAPYVIGADTQVRTLQAFHTMNVQSLIKHSMLHNRVAFAGRHGACAEGVPGGFDVTFDPFLDGGDVGRGVLEVFTDS